MKEFKLLVPSVRNDNRQPHTTEQIEAFESALLENFGGFTIARPVSGAWQDDSGQVIRDVSTPVYFAGEDAGAARKIAEGAAVLFGQQCIYLCHPDGSAELIDHPDPESVAYVGPPTIATAPDAGELVGPDGELLAAPRRS